MIDQTTRRDVLSAVCAAGGISGLSVPTMGEGNRGIQVVESGIRYEIPPNENYVTTHVDSRPPFTIDRERRNLVVPTNASLALLSDLDRAINLFDERNVNHGSEVIVTSPNRRVTAVPTELSNRMRVRKEVSLVSAIRYPTITLRSTPNEPILNIKSVGKRELAPDERVEIELEPLSIDVQTSHVIGKVSDSHIAPHQRALKREKDSITVQATPVVEAVNHGKLDLVQQRILD